MGPRLLLGSRCPSLAILLGLGIASAGCIRIPQPPADMAGREVGRPAQFVSATQPAGPVGAGWAESFADPALPKIIAEALANNPDLRQAAARVDEARARVRIATSYLLPEFDGTGSAGRQKIAPTGTKGGTSTFTSYDVGGQVNWEIDLWGRLRSARQAEKETLVATQLDYDFARLSLAASVADAWFVAIQARQQLAIDRERLDTEERTARITRDKVQTGVGGQLDAEMQESNLRLAAEAVARDEQSIGELTKALEALLGRYPANELALAEDLPRLPATAPVGVPSELLERRPDIRAADRRVAAAFHATESAKAARLPQVTISASLGWLIDPNQSYWSVAGGLLAPLFDAGRREAQVQVFSAQQAQALSGYVSTAIGAFKEVETALGNEQFLARRQTELEQASLRMRTASRIGEDRYAAGVLSIVDLTTIRRQDFDSRTALLQIRASRLRERLALYRALGGPMNSPTTQPGTATRAAGENTQEQKR